MNPFALLRPLWNYRGFVLASVAREFRSRYLGSLLGAAWPLINPIATIIVYTLIFSAIMQARLPGIDSTFAYSIYLCSGILTWGFFSETMTRLQGVFVENANLLKKVNFPRICLPTIVALSALTNFAIVWAMFILFLLITGHFPGWAVTAFIPVLLIQIIFGIGLGVWLGTLNVFFRDVGQFVGIVLQFWFWLTPIVYPLNIVPDGFQSGLQYNPMFPIIQAYQDIFVYAKVPAWETLWPVSFGAIVLCWLGLSSFRRHAGEMVDEL